MKRHCHSSPSTTMNPSTAPTMNPSTAPTTLPTPTPPLTTLPNPFPSKPTTFSSDHFYHRLESAYTEIRFKARVLSKRDRIVVNTFAELAKELPIDIFLVIFEREAVDRAVPLIAKQISDLDAGILVYNVPLDAGSLAFDFQEPLTAAKGKFCEAGLLFVARDSLVDFLMSCSGVPANPSLHPGVRAGTLLPISSTTLIGAASPRIVPASSPSSKFCVGELGRRIPRKDSAPLPTQGSASSCIC